MMDRRNKGGRSLVLRCSAKLRGIADCPFYCKLRLSGKDGKWYFCTGFHGNHECAYPVAYPSQKTLDARKRKASN